MPLKDICEKIISKPRYCVKAIQRWEIAYICYVYKCYAMSIICEKKWYGSEKMKNKNSLVIV